ncbi:hypothetical protein FALCPG4_005662 [Fusarium falciforme]
MPSSVTLCEWCARVPFDPDILSSLALRIRAYHLGSGRRVKNSPCPFCRLVVDAFSASRSDLHEHPNVKIAWMVGPGGRWAFRVSGTRPDTWIGFNAQSTRQVDRRVAIRSVRWNYFIEPMTEPVIDTERILGWISSCEETHGSKCALPTDLAFTDSFRGLHLLRLIDIEAKCLVEVTCLLKYVALSYVWGAVSNFRLTNANRAALLKPGSLNEVSHLLPETITDAIVFVQRLGGRYLWVDALCLLQNDTEDLDQGIDAMDLIFERAWLTLVAGCGHDANARLPGVQGGTRRASQNAVQVKPGVEMGVVTGLEGLLKNSVYDSRAWTFQEHILSRRVIYFVGDKVFYRCRAAEHSEDYADILSQQSVHSTWASMLPGTILMTEPIVDYSIMLFYYTKRALTDQHDAPRAMAGIMRRFIGAMRCQFLECIPTALFDRFIIFHGFNSILHRRIAFPSYSWTGWRGSISVDLDLDDSGEDDGNDWLTNRTWIVWYMRSPSGITSLVWDPAEDQSFPSQEEKCIGYRNRRPFCDGRRISTQADTRRSMPTEGASFSRELPPYPVLQFWTLSVFYEISDIDVFQATGYLSDSKNTRCGFVWLDGFEETTFFESQDTFEAILLSEAYSHASCEKLENWSDENYPRAAGLWRYFNILLLEWRGGIAERCGFGLLFQGAVENSLAPGPVWKEIFLA